jgi:dTDP-4-amino-4,6-dideoxygalactose transaminase
MSTIGNAAMPGPELDALAACLAGTGLAEDSPQLAEFEQRLATLAGLDVPALATTSASAAMQLALTGLEVKAGDRVVASTLCGIRFVNPVIHLGARPLLLDVEPEGLSLDPSALARFLDTQCLRRSNAWFERESGRRVAAVILPWLGGLQPRRTEVHELCRRHNLHLVELPESPFMAEPAAARADARVLDFSHRELGLGGGGALLSPHATVIQNARWWAGLCRPAGESGPR